MVSPDMEPAITSRPGTNVPRHGTTVGIARVPPAERTDAHRPKLAWLRTFGRLRTRVPRSLQKSHTHLGGRVEHVMALRSTLAPSIPVAHETPKVAEQSNAGAIEAGPSEEGRRRRARFHGHIKRTDVRIAPPSANLQRTGLMRRHRRADAGRRHNRDEFHARALVDRLTNERIVALGFGRLPRRERAVCLVALSARQLARLARAICSWRVRASPLGSL